MFKPKVTKVTIEVEGESADFYVRQAGAKEMLQMAQSHRKTPDRSLLDQQLEQLKLLSLDESGTPLTKADMDEIMGMSYSALKKLNAAINANSGITESAEDAEKNA
jgi:spore germination cell wall hydrolase CwlJ-like protein